MKKSDSTQRSIRSLFLESLLRVLPERPGIVVIHSSFPNLAPPADFSIWDALYSLNALVRQGWTVALPAFTFSFCRGMPFCAKKTPSEVGILADALLKHFPDAVRTPHPIYSFATMGERALEIAAASAASTTTWGDDSPFGLYEREGASIVMLGASWGYNTQFHRYEELKKVPYRYWKVFSGMADFGEGARRADVTMLVRNLDINPVNDYSSAICRLREAGLIASAPLWRGRVEAAAVTDIARVCHAELAANPYVYVAESGRVARDLALRAEASSQPPLRVAVIGSFNLHILEEAWRTRLAELLPERYLEFYSLPFGQMRQALVVPDSELRKFAPALRVFCDRMEDVAGADCLAVEQAVERVREYAEGIAAFHEAVGGWSVVHRFAVLSSESDADTVQAHAALAARLNGVMDEVLGSRPQVAWVDVAAEAAAHNGAVLDLRLWYIGRFAFTEGFSVRLAQRWAGLTLAIVAKTARLVVVDLDNTLWGGAVGEDGLAGLKIGGDYPGNAFASFQSALKKLRARGVALAIASKNDEDMTLRALDELPSMVLRSSDFSARRINWQPKWQNISEMAAELNLGLESILFVDDNSVEREGVRRNLPGVKVLELPADPALFAETLVNSPYLSAVGTTDEDCKRILSFKASQQRTAEKVRAASLEDFYASLSMKLHLAPLDFGNVQRAVQLCQKTNQFNTTSRRYELGALEKLVKSGADVVVVGLEDRHSPLENIGLIILKPEGSGEGTIDLYLLSCRILGRGIENVIPRWAVGRALRRGWTRLWAEVIETPRNTPVRGVFAEAAFSADRPGFWSISTQATPGLPPWLTVIDRVSNL